MTKIVQDIEALKPFEVVTWRCLADHVAASVWYLELDLGVVQKRWYVASREVAPRPYGTIMLAADAVACELEHII